MPISLGDPVHYQGFNCFHLPHSIWSESNTVTNRRLSYFHAVYNSKGKELLKNTNSSNLAWIQLLSVRGPAEVSGDQEGSGEIPAAERQI